MEFVKFVAYVLIGTTAGTAVLGGAVKLLMLTKNHNSDQQQPTGTVRVI
jgi:hypothetical protein